MIGSLLGFGTTMRAERGSKAHLISAIARDWDALKEGLLVDDEVSYPR